MLKFSLRLSDSAVRWAAFAFAAAETALATSMAAAMVLGSKAIEKLLPCMKWNTRFKFWQLNCVPAAEAAPLLPDRAVSTQLPPCDDDAWIRRRRRRELVRVGHLAADSK